MAENGVRTPDFDPASSADEIIANKDGNTVRVPYERLAAQVRASFGPVYQTLAELEADLSWPASTLAVVWADAGSNGDYVKIGAAGTGSWSRVGDSAQFLAAEKARAWAEKDEDIEVEPGEYSAKHWAAKARGEAEAGAVAATELAQQHAASAAASAAQASATAAGLAGFDLGEISSSVAVAAVQAVVYDTRLDPDGGLWRDRCQYAAWWSEPLNTATRGARQAFPAIAVVIAEADKITIYDGDVPALPMWQVIDVTGETITGVAVAAGRIAVGLDGTGVAVLDYTAAALSVAARYTASSSPAISDNAVNAVAAVALPTDDVSSLSGLPGITIAVAAGTGCSVIHADDTVATSLAGNVEAVAITDEILLFSTGTAIQQVPIRETLADGFTSTSVYDNTSGIGLTGGAAGRIAAMDGLAFAAGTDALALVRHEAPPLAAAVTTTYTSGWMPGDIKGAWLADTDGTALVGATPLDDDFTAYADQAAAEAAGWSADLGWTFDAAGDQWDFDASVAGGGVSSSVVRSVAVVAGETYMAEAVISGTTNLQSNEFFVQADGNNLLTAEESVSVTADGIVSCTFVASSSLIEVKARSGGATEGDETFSLDRFTIRRADADTDRSLNNRDLTIVGTISRAPVATGAELMAYSGFSVSDYLESTDAAYSDALYGLCWVQTGGVWNFQHGVISAAPIEGVAITGTTLTVGGATPKALLRLTATVPTSEQIARIEAEERALFQPGAACTLYGASGAVAAIGYDQFSGLLHAGTPDGRSTFRGLRRVATTTNAVTTFIAATGGIIAEQ